MWKKQGEAFVGQVTLIDGRKGKTVVVGARDNPKGATLLVPKEGSESPEMLPLQGCVHLLAPESVIDILCVQERAFGTAGLEPPSAAST